jgi:hypothetical protein
MSHKKFSPAQGALEKTGHSDKSKDAPTTVTKFPIEQDARQKPLKGTTESCMDGADRQAIERGEDEGMIVSLG